MAKLDLKLYDIQNNFLQDKKRFPAFIGGRGTGKSYIGCVKDVFYIVANPGCEGVICAPCYDDQTEVLTAKRGWRLFRDLLPDDQVATLSDGDKVVYQTPTQHFDYPYDGNLLYLNNQEVDLAMTPNHRCWTRFKNGSWQIKTAADLYGKHDWKFKKTGVWEGGHTTHSTAYFEFLGFWFAKGYAESNSATRTYRVVLTQKKDCAYAESVIGAVFPDYKRDARQNGGYNYTIYDKKLATEFASYGKALTKSLPLWVKNAPGDHLRAFLRGYIRGDGHQKSGTHDQTQMWTSSPALASDLQEIAFKAGFSCNQSVRRGNQHDLCIRTPLRHEPSTEPRHWSTRPYQGRVFCVEVPNGVIYVRRGGKGVWCGNTYPMLRDTTQRTFFSLFPREFIKSFNKTDNVLETMNGSIIFFRSLDNPDRARGYNSSFVHIDEAAYVVKEAWDILKATNRKPGFPLQMWLTSTPKGRNWIYDEWGDNPDEAHTIHQARSSDNPFLPPDFEQSLGYKGQFFAQEVLGEFTSFDGLVYPGFTRSLVSHAPDKRPLRTLVGTDFGFRDPAVLVAFSDYGDGCVRVSEEWYKSGQTIAEQIAAANDLMARWPVEAFIADPSRPDSIAAMRQAGLRVIEADNDILTGISCLTSIIDAKALSIDPTCVFTIEEFETYQWPEDRPNRNTKDRPLDFANHAMDALRYTSLYWAKERGDLVATTSISRTSKTRPTAYDRFKEFLGDVHKGRDLLSDQGAVHDALATQDDEGCVGTATIASSDPLSYLNLRLRP